MPRLLTSLLPPSMVCVFDLLFYFKCFEPILTNQTNPLFLFSFFQVMSISRRPPSALRSSQALTTSLSSTPRPSTSLPPSSSLMSTSSLPLMLVSWPPSRRIKRPFLFENKRQRSPSRSPVFHCTDYVVRVSFMSSRQVEFSPSPSQRDKWPKKVVHCSRLCSTRCSQGWQAISWCLSPWLAHTNACMPRSEPRPRRLAFCSRPWQHLTTCWCS